MGSEKIYGLVVACETGSPELFVKELDKLKGSFRNQADSQPRKEGMFLDEDFAETGEILFPNLLPEDYPFRQSYVECWTWLYALRLQLEENKSSHPRGDAKGWHSCIVSSYRDQLPVVAKKLEKCFIQLRLLDKEH